MSAALQLAKQGLGGTSPNPIVGAVCVNHGRIVGRGYHKQAGGPHAEVFALDEAGPLAAGSTLYVTLEPCSHYGRTPPCANRCIEAGVQRVVVAMADPNPRVAGHGLQRLREAGIQVEVGLMEAEARRANEVYLTYIENGRPFIHFKTAMSLDGKIACASGKSQWITGPESRAEVHRLRSQHDAILVGIGTALADDPLLTARLPSGALAERQPIRIIVDSHARLPLSARCLQVDAGELIVATTDTAPARKVEALRERGVRVWSHAGIAGRVDLPTFFEHLAQLEVTSVLVEGGPQVAGTLFDTGLVDRMTAFVAPIVLGGTDAPSPVAGVGANDPTEGWHLIHTEQRAFGPDLMLTGTVGRVKP